MTDNSPAKDVLASHPAVKTIICEGAPRSIGFAHGQQAAQEIVNNVETYTFFFRETAQLTWAQARDKAATIFVPVLRKQYPDILIEMAAIAEGAGHGLVMEDILTLNTRSEIALTCYADGCTSLAQSGSHGDLYLCQNWDWLEELQRGIVFLHITPEMGSAMEFISEAGIIGKIGCNSAGFGLCMNAIRSGAFSRSGFPIHVLNRWMLQHCQSVEDGIAAIDRFGTCCTGNYVIADSGGDFVDIEASPRGNVAIKPSVQNKYVLHTNHLRGPNRPARLRDFPAQNSFDRLTRIHELTERDANAHVATSFESLRRRLSDEQGYPYSICRDRPPGAVGMERMTTIATVMMEMRQRKIRIVVGRPCLELPVVEWDF